MAREAVDYQERIVTDPQILVGKPTIKGTRISVERVLEYLAVNPNFEALFTDYPRLTMEDVQACLAYAQAKVAKRANGKTPVVPRSAHV